MFLRISTSSLYHHKIFKQFIFYANETLLNDVQSDLAIKIQYNFNTNNIAKCGAAKFLILLLEILMNTAVGWYLTQCFGCLTAQQFNILTSSLYKVVRIGQQLHAIGFFNRQSCTSTVSHFMRLFSEINEKHKKQRTK